MITVHTEFNYGFRWFERSGIHVKGYLFDGNDVLYRNGEVIDYFSGVDSEEDFERKLRAANGIFCVIIKRDTRTFFGVDRTRTFPLFYTKHEKTFYITDTTYYLKRTLNLTQSDPLSEEEFLHTGYVTGENTLLDAVYQLQAGQYAVVEHTLKKKYYFEYATDTVITKEYDVLEKELLHIFERIFNRLIRSVAGRTIVIPLSGGYDSRLTAVMLKKMGYTDVICFTYGRSDSFEVSISRKVADRLGFKWVFVEYHESLFHNFTSTDIYKEYAEFAANHTSVFMLQDYFAVKYMHDNGLIPVDSVMVPGHTGDFIAGGHIPARLQKKRGKGTIINEILKRHYILKKIHQPEQFRTKIFHQLNEGLAHSCFEDWELKERQAKFIVNADRTYEIFGYEHRIPLWDHELIEFFKYLDVTLKFNRKLYDNFLEEKLFRTCGVDFQEPYKTKEKKWINKQLQNIKIRIKPVIPRCVMDKYKMKKDINCLFHMSRIMLDSMTSSDGIDIWNDNAVIAHWYIEQMNRN